MINKTGQITHVVNDIEHQMRSVIIPDIVTNDYFRNEVPIDSFEKCVLIEALDRLVCYQMQTPENWQAPIWN